MSAIRSALDELTGVDDDRLSVAELAADIGELSYVAQRVDVLMARKTKSLADRGGHRELGFSSPSAFLCATAGMSPGEAKRVVSRATAANKASYAFRAWVDGRLSTGQAGYLFRAAEAVPEFYPDAEERLVEIVEGLDVVDTGRAVEYWRQSAAGPGECDPESHRIRRGLSLSETAGGMRRLDGWLTPTLGAAFEAILDVLVPPRRETDLRSRRQRRHDAFEDLCRDWLDNGATSGIGGEKPHVIVHTDLDALAGLAGGLHETENGQVIDVDTLRMVACDSSVSRIIFGPGSEVLDVGRKTRVWTTAQRRAIIARDRHCQGPGCRAKPRYCDIHHTEHWADGGTTSIDKGELLCRPCHTGEHSKDAFHRKRRKRART